MYTAKFDRTDTPVITIIPSYIYLKLANLLDREKIEYRKIHRYDLPVGCPGGCTYRGKLVTDSACGIETYVTSESLFKVAEDIFHINLSDIEII